jgi:hypothetical protein
MRVEVGNEQRSLEEDKAGDPDSRGSAERGKKLLGGDGFNKEEKEGGKKDSGGKERP